MDRFCRRLSIQHLHLPHILPPIRDQSWFSQFHENALHEYRALKARAHTYKYATTKHTHTYSGKCIKSWQKSAKLTGQFAMYWYYAYACMHACMHTLKETLDDITHALYLPVRLPVCCLQTFTSAYVNQCLCACAKHCKQYVHSSSTNKSKNSKKKNVIRWTWSEMKNDEHIGS